MAHTIELADEDYAALASASAHSGRPIEWLLHEAITEFCSPPESPARYPYPTEEAFVAGERDEGEHVLQEPGSEQPGISDTVLEDSGPR